MDKYLKITVLLILMIADGSYGQTNQEVKTREDDKDSFKQIIIYENDTIVNDAIELDEVMIMPKLNFDDKDEYRRYLILQRKTRKVWPLVVIASKRLDTFKNRLEKIDSKRKKRKYTRIVQDYMENKFKKRLMKLSHTEGQILVKLVHRQTGFTMFNLLKDLKSGWSAFWYQTTARVFEISLKEEYQPMETKRDFMIEDILRRSFDSDVLEQQDPATDISFSKLVDNWGDDIQFYN